MEARITLPKGFTRHLLKKMSGDVRRSLERIETKVDALLELLRRRDVVKSGEDGDEEGGDEEDSDEEECPPVIRSATELSRLSAAALRDGKNDVALELATQALTVNPDSVSALRARGKAFSQKRVWESARADFSQAQQIDYDEETEALLKEACAKVATTTASAPSPGRPRAGHPRGLPTGLNVAAMTNPDVMGSVANVLRNPEAMKAIHDVIAGSSGPPA